jgi:hypothetical protein
VITFSLACDNGHDFEGWFRSSADFDAQEKDGQLECPVCASHRVGKALMAPAVAGTREEASPVLMADPRDGAMRQMMKAFRDHVVASSEDVGERFAEEARRIHFDETEKRSIRGKATPDEAQALREDGVPFAPLPVLPDDQN